MKLHAVAGNHTWLSTPLSRFFASPSLPSFLRAVISTKSLWDWISQPPPASCDLHARKQEHVVVVVVFAFMIDIQ
ncbi:hypothetical protein K440DRAFT_611174 [Wilcoxina mikolae CBS 423.85]|nr:hypothetical protein K440DRAFT_611174 [Wilcoxina mikolae CBS 423.85]